MDLQTQEMTGINSYGDYASADFSDSTEASPMNLVGDVSYVLAINNAVNKHYNELKGKLILNQHWNKKIREMLLLKNNKILEFLTCKLKKHPVLSSSEQFFQHFTKPINFNKSLKDIVLEISGNDILESFNTICLSNGFQTVEQYMEQSKYIVDQYKISIDKILDSEKLFKMKLDSLDSANNRLKNITSLTHNDHYNELMESIEKYTKQLFDDNAIESDYNNIINQYKTYITLRDILRVIRIPDVIEKEPLCSICFENTISHAFIPCGHTFCELCVKRQSLSCSVCRSNVREFVKIYFT